ncbi:MAG: NAD(P)-dependent oxidoreductase [Verrucomicrobiota bacterium]
MNAANPFADDLDLVLARTKALWPELRGQRIFITGGTGFFGRWLLESFAWANHQLDLKAEAVVLTRNPEAFAKKAPQLAGNPAIRLQAGDIGDFRPPPGRFSHVIHGATEASEKSNQENPLRMFDTIVSGTRRTLEFAAEAKVRKFLFISSGAVYGKQPAELSHMPEDYTGAPDPTHPLSAYGEGKRAGEMLSVLLAQRHGFEAKIARAFAFVGPQLPLDGHFAVGNFMRDGLAGGPIQVLGDGTPVRSYLYAAELAVWLWTILFQGANARAYNVGSETCLSIAETARAVADSFSPPLPVRIRTPAGSGAGLRYVPCTRRAREELGLTQEIEPCRAIEKTLRWLQNTHATHA